MISVAERQAYIGRVRDLAKGACGAWMDAQGVCGVSADFLLELLSRKFRRGCRPGAQRFCAAVCGGAGEPGLTPEAIDDLFDAAAAGADRARPAAGDRGGQRRNQGPAHIGAAAGAGRFPSQDRADAGATQERDGTGSRGSKSRAGRRARCWPRRSRRSSRLPVAKIDALGRVVGIDSSLRWVRPLHGIVALLGEEIVPVAIDGIAVRRDDGRPSLPSSGHDHHRRRARLCRETARLPRDRRPGRARGDDPRGCRQGGDGGRPELVADEGLVVENAGLTEWPMPLLGRFDPDFLDVPRR